MTTEESATITVKLPDSLVADEVERILIALLREQERIRQARVLNHAIGEAVTEKKQRHGHG